MPNNIPGARGFLERYAGGRYASAVYRAALEQVNGALAHEIRNLLQSLKMGLAPKVSGNCPINCVLVDERQRGLLAASHQAARLSVERLTRLADIASLGYSRWSDDAEATSLLYSSVESSSRLLHEFHGTQIVIADKPVYSIECVGTQKCVNASVYAGIWAATHAALDDGRVAVHFWRDMEWDGTRFPRTGVAIEVDEGCDRRISSTDLSRCLLRNNSVFRFGADDAIALAALSGGGGELSADGRQLNLYWRIPGASFRTPNRLALVECPEYVDLIQNLLGGEYQVTSSNQLASALNDPRVTIIVARISKEWNDRALLNLIRYRLRWDIGFRIFPLTAQLEDEAFIDIEFGDTVDMLKLPYGLRELDSKIRRLS